MLTGRNMRKFSDFGIKADDNIFECPCVSITDIVNVKIIVLDYVPNINTRHGEGRFLVHFKNADDGEMGKFFTTSKDICFALEQIGKDNLPFETIIKALKLGGGGKKYRFT